MRTIRKQGIPTNKVTFAILGAGNRGYVYAASHIRFPEQMEVTAIADTRQVSLDAVAAMLDLLENKIFHSADELLSQPKLAQVMAICTQDVQHKELLDSGIVGRIMNVDAPECVSNNRMAYA